MKPMQKQCLYFSGNDIMDDTEMCVMFLWQKQWNWMNMESVVSVLYGEW